MNKPTDNFSELRNFLYAHLMESVMPFWVEHSIDPAGGVNTCIGDDGAVISRDKWLWSQWRMAWVFSKLYNSVEADEKWQHLARHVYDFVVKFGWSEDEGGWNLCLSHDGSVIRGTESLSVDAFAIDGLVEFAKAMPAKSNEIISLARKTADHVIKWMKQPHDKIPQYPYPVPKGAKVHGIPMMASFMIWKLGRYLDDPYYLRFAQDNSDEIFNHFYRPDRDVLLERISEDNSEYPAPEGTTVIPGHVIEDMWFQIHIARYFGDTQRIKESCRLIRRHLELGWDEEYGGVILGIDADNRSDIAWKSADTKRK